MFACETSGIQSDVCMCCACSWGIDHLKVDGCKQFDTVNMNSSYAVVGSFLLSAAKKRGSPVVYHPSNLGFRHPRQFHELIPIANQWRWFDDVDDTWSSISGIIEEVGAGQPHCINAPPPASCKAFDFSTKAQNCSKYCSEVLRFVTTPRPGAWHDPDMVIIGNTPCSNISKANGMHCGTFTQVNRKIEKSKTHAALLYYCATAFLFLFCVLQHVLRFSIIG
eukprot:SAG31_NODE_5170_length_2701_cov_3.885473_4_plen_222_part_00